MYTLRPFQERAFHEAMYYINNLEEKDKVLMVAPVAAGKSLYIASIANALPFPILILQPSKELLKQNYAKYISYGGEASIYSASLKSRDIGHVTFATIKSIVKEIEKFKKLGIGLVLIDEAHLQTKHASLIGRFLKELNPPKVIGLTATPIELRSSMGNSYLVMLDRSRKNIFNRIIHITQVSEIISGGYWAKIIYEEKKLIKDKLRLNTLGSDYTEDSMNEYYRENELDDKIIATIARLREEGRKSIIIFMPSVATAENLSKKIPRSMCVSSNTPTPERDATITSFTRGVLEVILNVNVLSVGFDHPALDAIITARPTKSFAIYYQQLGRGVRPFTFEDGTKKDCRLVDFSGNVAEFGYIEAVEFKETKGKLEMFSGKKKLTSNWMEKNKPPTTIAPPKPITAIDIFDDFFNTPKVEDTIWFGKHKDKTLKDIPLDYLQWIIRDMPPQTKKMEVFHKQIKSFLKTKNIPCT